MLETLCNHFIKRKVQNHFASAAAQFYLISRVLDCSCRLLNLSFVHCFLLLFWLLGGLVSYYSIRTWEWAQCCLGERERERKKNYKPPGVPMQSFFVPWNKAECRVWLTPTEITYYLCIYQCYTYIYIQTPQLKYARCK